MKHSLLSTTSVKALTKPGYYLDGVGLYLQVRQAPDGRITKSWIFRYARAGKTRDMGLGGYPGISLAAARGLAMEQREHLARGDDPLDLRDAKKEAARIAKLENQTFKHVAEEYLALWVPTFRNEKHGKQWRTTLKATYGSLGHRPAIAIDALAINTLLKPMYEKTPVTAARTKQRIERVIQWLKDGRPAPRIAASKRVKHHAAMPISELPAFMLGLRARDSISARALEFTILTAARTGDTIDAKWDEIDLERAVWTISDGRHKTGKTFEVPLSRRAIEILDSLPRVNGYVFPGAKAGKPISNMTMLELLKSATGTGYTVHGFRSTFRDWAGDHTSFPREVIEAAMSHQIKDKAEAAYRRSNALEKRRELMEEWSKRCATPFIEGVKNRKAG